MGNKQSGKRSQEDDFLYIQRMTLFMCAMHFDKQKKSQDDPIPSILTTKRSLSCNVRPMQLIYLFLKPPINVSEVREMLSMQEPRILVFDNIKGHAGQCMLNGAWFRTKIVHNNSPVFRLRGTECFGHSDMVLFKDTADRWRMASDSVHRKTGKDICYLLGLNGKKNDESPLGAEFKIYNGTYDVFLNLFDCYFRIFFFTSKQIIQDHNGS